MRHLEDGQRLDEELRCRSCDLLELMGGSVGLEDLQQDGVMDSGQIKDAQALTDRPAAKLIGCPASRLAAVGEVLKEGGGIVTPEPLLHVPGHRRICRSGPRWSSRCRYARPSSRSRAVWTLSRPMPRRTMAKATVGWMPTMTVSAPRSRAAWARLSRVREPKESMTSRAATSMMTPRARWVPICSTRSCWNRTISRSFRASWMEAIR